MEVTVSVADASQWQPSLDAFLAQLHKLHSRDSVRIAVETGLRECQSTELAHYVQSQKSRLLARHLLIRRIHRINSGLPGAEGKYSALHIQNSARGKPIVHPLCGRELSVSHVADWVCCAASAVGHVGADIVPLHNADATLLDSILTAAEARSLEARELPQRTHLFAVYWALKECVLKALGLGLSDSLPMNEIALLFDSSVDTPLIECTGLGSAASTKLHSLTVSFRGGEGENWVFSAVTFREAPLHLFAVAMPRCRGVEKVEWTAEAVPFFMPP